MTPTAWLARVRHDLVKHVLWPARDRREVGGRPAPGELVPRVSDGEGRPLAAAELWRSLRAEAPRGLPLAAFDAALARALAAADVGDVAGVLALEEATDALARQAEALARSLEETEGEES
jgi:hypothetical protein